jgi:hypothetical protein
MSNGIPEPKESFFVSEALAGQLDMSQFEAPADDDTPSSLQSAVIKAEIRLGSDEVIVLDISSCSTTDNEAFGLVATISSATQVALLIGQPILSVALILANDLIFDVDLGQMKKTIEVQAAGGQYYLIALNFEKIDLLIKG